MYFCRTTYWTQALWSTTVTEEKGHRQKMLHKSRSKLAILNLFSKYTKHLKIQVQLKKGEDLADRKRAHIEQSVPFAELLES